MATFPLIRVLIRAPSKHHHHSTHERTGEDREERQELGNLGIARSDYEDATDSNDGNRDEAGFPGAAHGDGGEELQVFKRNRAGNGRIGDAVLRRSFAALRTSA